MRDPDRPVRNCVLPEKRCVSALSAPKIVPPRVPVARGAGIAAGPVNLNHALIVKLVFGLNVAVLPDTKAFGPPIMLNEGEPEERIIGRCHGPFEYKRNLRSLRIGAGMIAPSAYYEKYSDDYIETNKNIYFIPIGV